MRRREDIVQFVGKKIGRVDFTNDLLGDYFFLDEGTKTFLPHSATHHISQNPLSTDRTTQFGVKHKLQG